MDAYHVLVVDDNPLLLDLLRLMLETLGYEVSTARGAGEALAQVETVQPDLALVDLMMPIVDGENLCRRIQGLQTAGGGPALVLMSADERARPIATELGLAGWLLKPFDLDQLITCIESCRGLPEARSTVERAHRR